MDTTTTLTYSDGQCEYSLKELQLAGQTIFYMTVMNSVDNSFFIYKNDGDNWNILNNGIIDKRLFNIEINISSFLKSKGY